MSSEKSFTKENLNFYLCEVAKEYKKLGGRNMPAEIILVGGAATLADYGFRDTTYDIDAVILASSLMKEAINHVGDRFGLPNGWMNNDFESSSSYSSKIRTCSKYYRTFANIVSIRTVTAEYLVAMKLKSARQYKNDISDIAGIIAEQKEKGKPISYSDVDHAVTELYGSWDGIPSVARKDLNDILSCDDPSSLYRYIRKREQKAQDIIIHYAESHPGKLKKENINDVIQSLQYIDDKKEKQDETISRSGLSKTKKQKHK